MSGRRLILVTLIVCMADHQNLLANLSLLNFIFQKAEQKGNLCTHVSFLSFHFQVK